MVQYDPLAYLPSAEELPDSDDTPVDNEFQNLIPNLLLASLALAWPKRMDWFFGVDMGIYYTPSPRPIPIVPDGFLSLGVPRRTREPGRLSYVLWEENWVVPKLVLESVSQTYGGEYDEKLAKYAQLGALYYVIYNPDFWRRDKHEPFEVYQLTDGQYVRLPGEPVWLPEIELGIGRGQGEYGGWMREWLYWYDRSGRRLTTPEELAAQERQRAEQERQRAEQASQQLESLLENLRAQGIDPSKFLTDVDSGAADGPKV
ncbi:Uma2 family endonuclease [Leptolyngbya sp. FACHB-261]|uniref:Uma2 family endonuclease n=1 Tax=Leptolyngbya sp. FACHB-261 TaxID=2692806 RepID=UPI0016860577|nr:Uma2 family endonuclease [Leptolyngbya sp. FACHB-261]MBD2104365.1 Uma2 family endonuclease [Leptolyngbya sp. FACHB-261]